MWIFWNSRIIKTTTSLFLSNYSCYDYFLNKFNLECQLFPLKKIQVRKEFTSISEAFILLIVLPAKIKCEKLRWKSSTSTSSHPIGSPLKKIKIKFCMKQNINPFLLFWNVKSISCRDSNAKNQKFFKVTFLLFILSDVTLFPEFYSWVIFKSLVTES